MRVVVRALRFPFIVAMVWFSALPAQAAPVTIVNTGTPTVTGAGGWTLGSTFDHQWLAGEFTTTALYEITSVEGWMDVRTGGDLRFALYSDGGEVPGAPLFSTVLNLGTGAEGWRGAFGLSWLIGPGTYWLAFESPVTSSFDGLMPATAPMPLLTEAFQNDFLGNVWISADYLDIGVRIVADGATVPEPATLLLLGTAIAVAGARRGRRNRN